jgi:hypothetical protein
MFFPLKQHITLGPELPQGRAHIHLSDPHIAVASRLPGLAHCLSGCVCSFTVHRRSDFSPSSKSLSKFKRVPLAMRKCQHMPRLRLFFFARPDYCSCRGKRSQYHLCLLNLAPAPSTVTDVFSVQVAVSGNAGCVLSAVCPVLLCALACCVQER